MDKKSPWQQAIENSGTTLTLEKLQQAVQTFKDRMNEPPTFTDFHCKMCGKADHEEDSRMHHRFRSFKDGVFACCLECRFK